jgi:voltage-gated potassium channel
MRSTEQHSRLKRFLIDISVHTPFTRMALLLIMLWLLFSAGMYLAERNIEGTSINSYGEALYWGVAAFSTAGIAGKPISGAAELIGGLWIVIGSVLREHRGNCDDLFHAADAAPAQEDHRNDRVQPRAVE